MAVDLLELTRQYFGAIEREASAAGMKKFFAEDVVQEEYPNQFVREGARRDLKELMEAGERGRAAVTGERYGS